MRQEIKIEKKASEVIQPRSVEEAQEAIRTRQDLSGADLRGMALKNISAVSAVLRKTDLTKADLSYGLLINPNFYKASLHDAAAHNTIILGGDLVKTSLIQADLSHSAIIGTDASESDFEGANLRSAALVGTNFTNANFTQANLTDARLTGLDVTGADFTDTDLTGTRAHNVNWEKAKVQPHSLPGPLIQLSAWTWSVILGGFLGVFALLIYSRTRKKRKPL